MPGLDLTQVAEELYGLPPGGFIGVRDERVRQARDAGDPVLAEAIRKLRRPAMSAWLVNQLARQAAGQVGELLTLGGELREAQRNLAGDLLRELAARRREQVVALLRRAQGLAGEAGVVLSAQARREVASTLEAALGDPAAAELVRGGRLTIPLSFVGLGATGAAEPVKLRDAAVSGAGGTAGQPVTRRSAGQPVARRGTGERAARVAAEQAAQEAAQRAVREAAAARQDLREAGEQVQEAQVALEEAEHAAGTARQQRDDARQRIAALEAQLAEAHAADAQASRDLREVKRSRDLAAKSLEAAQRRLARAWTRASKGSGP